MRIIWNTMKAARDNKSGGVFRKWSGLRSEVVKPYPKDVWTFFDMLAYCGTVEFPRWVRTNTLRRPIVGWGIAPARKTIKGFRRVDFLLLDVCFILPTNPIGERFIWSNLVSSLGWGAVLGSIPTASAIERTILTIKSKNYDKVNVIFRCHADNRSRFMDCRVHCQGGERDFWRMGWCRRPRASCRLASNIYWIKNWGTEVVGN